MIKTQIIKEKNIPKLVIMDFSEYQRLKEIEQDKIDYYESIAIKRTNKKWTKHENVKKMIDKISK